MNWQNNTKPTPDTLKKSLKKVSLVDAELVKIALVR